LDGDVSEDVKAGIAAFELNGAVGRDVYVDMEGVTSQDMAPPTTWMPFMPPVTMIAAGARLGDDATVGGDMTYRITDYNLELPDGAEVILVDVPVEEEQPTGFVFPGWLRNRIGETVSLFIVGALFLLFLPDQLQSVMDELKGRPWPSLGVGLLSVIVVPIVLLFAIGLLIALVIIIAIITLGNLSGTVMSLGGLTIGAVGTLFGFAISLGSKAILAYFIGKLLLERVSPTTLEGRWGKFLALLVGVVLYEIVRSIPLGVGFLVAVVVVLFGVGAIALVVYERLRAPAMAAEA
jgi:hypothetical protein